MSKNKNTKNAETATRQFFDLNRYKPRNPLPTIKEFFVTQPHLWLSFVIPFFLLFAAYMYFGVFPKGEKSVLALDFNAQYVYYFIYMKDALFGAEDVLYSWARNLSGEFVGIAGYYLYSPFNFIVWIMPVRWITESLMLMMLTKIGTIGLTMAIYLNHRKFSKHTVVLFSVMYALCSYNIVQTMNPMWLDGVLALPLVVMGLEALMKDGKYKLFIFSLVYAFLTCFYIGYMIAIFAALYFFYYSYTSRKGNLYFVDVSSSLVILSWFVYFYMRFYVVKPDSSPGTGIKIFTVFLTLAFLSYFVFRLIKGSTFFKKAILFATAAALAAMISSFMLLPVHSALSQGKYGFSVPNWSFRTQFDLLDASRKWFLNTYDTVRMPEGMPFVFAGTLSLLLLPAYFLCDRVRRARRFGGVMLLTVLVVSMFIIPVDMVWHGMQTPNWLPYRYSFMISFLVVAFGAEAFHHIKRIPHKVFGIWAAFFAGVLIYWQYADTVIAALKTGDKEGREIFALTTTILPSFAALMIFAGILIIARNKMSKYNMFTCVLIALVCIEMLFNTRYSLEKQHGDIYYSSRKSFNSMQYTREVMQDIIKEDKGFWRSEKTYIRSACDSMAVLQKGMTHSSSMLNVKAIDLLKELGYQSRSHSSRFSGNTPLTDDLFGFKYILSVKGYTPDNNDSRNHDKIKSKEDISIYENEDYLPIAYLVSPDMKEYTFDKNQVFKNQNKMLSDMLISSVKSAYVNSPAVLTNLEELGGNYLIFSKTNTMFDEVGDLLPSQINYTINPEEDGHYYLNLPSAVDNKYRLSVNGYEISPIFDNAFYLGYYYLGESFNVTLSVDSERVYFETAMFLRSVNPEIDSKIGFTGREDDYFGVNEDENSDFNPDDENPDLNPDDENPDDPDADPDLNPDEENPDESEPVRPVQIIEGLNHTAVRDYVIEDEMQSYFVSIPNIETYPQNLRSFGNENTIYSKVSFDNDASIDYFLTAQSGGDYFAYFPGNYERAYDIYANDILLPQTRESNASKVFYLGEYNAGDEVKITLKLDANEIFFDNELFAVAEKDPLQFGGYTEERFYKRILSYIKTHDVEGNYYVQEIVPKDEKRNNLNFEERDDGFMYTKRDDSVASLEYTLTADESGQYFAYFPTDYPINYNLHVNGSLPTLNSPNYNEIREKGSDNVPYSSGNAIFESDYHAYYLGEFNAGESITVTLTFTADTVNFKKALFVRRVVGFEDEGVVRNIERVSNHFASDTNDRINKYFKKVVYDEKLPNDVVYEGTGDNHMGYKKVDAPTGNVHIEYVFEAAEADGEYYMYFPTDYERSCNLWLTRWDGTKWGEAEFKGIFYETDNYYLRNLGFISKGEKFKMTMSLLGDRVYFTEEMFMRLDRDLLESDIIRLHAMNEKTEFKAVNSRHMRVKSDYDTEMMLFTSIPNEPGWRASLNGERVEIEETAGGLIAISLPAGVNSVDLKFFPKRMPEGILLAILGLIGLVGLNFVAFKFGGLEKLPVRGLIKSKKRREDGIVTDDVDIFDGFDSDYVEEESDSDDFDFDIEVPKVNKGVKEVKETEYKDDSNN